MKSLGRRSTAKTAGQQAVRQQKERRVAEVADGRRRKDHERVERGRRWSFGRVARVLGRRESSSGERERVGGEKRCSAECCGRHKHKQAAGSTSEGDEAEAEKRPS